MPQEVEGTQGKPGGTTWLASGWSARGPQYGSSVAPADCLFAHRLPKCREIRSLRSNLQVPPAHGPHTHTVEKQFVSRHGQVVGTATREEDEFCQGERSLGHSAPPMDAILVAEMGLFRPSKRDGSTSQCPGGRTPAASPSPVSCKCRKHGMIGCPSAEVRPSVILLLPGFFGTVDPAFPSLGIKYLCDRGDLQKLWALLSSGVENLGRLKHASVLLCMSCVIWAEVTHNNQRAEEDVALREQGSPLLRSKINGMAVKPLKPSAKPEKHQEQGVLESLSIGKNIYIF